MRRLFLKVLITIFIASGLALLGAPIPTGFQTTNSAEIPSRAYLGFDRNIYPGDAALRLLRQSFSFSWYWLNAPPGERANTWQGKREILNSSGFGFLVLFNGRVDRELKSLSISKAFGTRDAAVATESARKEAFPAGTIIFLDQEEGGRMLPEQQAYVYAWVDGVNASGFRAGVYCSGIPASESGGATVVTANDLQVNAGIRKIVYFVYNDSCPPSPGCEFPGSPLLPRQSGVTFASIWQFAQSPRRRELTSGCPSHYAEDGNCYAPLFRRADQIEIDVDSATSADPSSGRPR
jgi:hypothetical protein